MPSGSEESRLVRAAASGDGSAFASLYETYERPIFNYVLRLLGDRHEAEDATQDAFIRVMAKLPELDLDRFEFAPYLYTAARNAGYDVIAKRKKVDLSGAAPDEASAPFRGELSDLEMDPERSALASSQEAAVKAANDRLPERQREVLALRELDGLSYDEIASVMEMKSNAVAQLISRARLGLRKEMRVGAAASVAIASPECERAHGEMACRMDGQVKGFDDEWLELHLAGCSNCRVASEEMAEAGVSYRAWAPVVPAAWLFREVMAKASGINGHDWSGIERPEPADGAGSSDADGEGPETGGASGAVEAGRSSRARRALIAGAGSVLVAAVLATVLLAEANAPEKVAVVRDSLVRSKFKPEKASAKETKKGKAHARKANRNGQGPGGEQTGEQTGPIDPASTNPSGDGGSGGGGNGPRSNGNTT
ncbi:MAG TPA: sigma-70 family RNA polymerase sigma factor, partial [Solirubrobacterales bacterium]|nr:sigma-70 family RNA polymerase sigma factor [Solirubrobacterales bacterium]